MPDKNLTMIVAKILLQYQVFLLGFGHYLSRRGGVDGSAVVCLIRFLYCSASCWYSSKTAKAKRAATKATIPAEMRRRGVPKQSGGAMTSPAKMAEKNWPAGDGIIKPMKRMIAASQVSVCAEESLIFMSIRGLFVWKKG
ncbi:MAG: hypothetical protein IBX46_02305 [Desulfuromonadales bacterium]|nr:hypothetical protein [Desulfuromonadales bacterium]